MRLQIKGAGECHVLIVKYRDHIGIRYLDTANTYHTLKKDLELKLENRQSGKVYDVCGFSNVTNGSVIYTKNGINRIKYGVERLLMVNNSEWSEFIQYVLHTEKWVWEVGKFAPNPNWRLDGDACYDQTKLNDTSAFMLDAPGMNLPADVRTLNKLLKKTHADSIDQFTRSDFETFVWCEGKIYGYLTWGYEVSASFTKNSVKVKSVDAVPVIWHDDPSLSQNYPDAIKRPAISQSLKFRCCE